MFAFLWIQALVFLLFFRDLNFFSPRFFLNGSFILFGETMVITNWISLWSLTVAGLLLGWWIHFRWIYEIIATLYDKILFSMDFASIISGKFKVNEMHVEASRTLDNLSFCCSYLNEMWNVSDIAIFVLWVQDFFLCFDIKFFYNNNAGIEVGFSSSKNIIAIYLYAKSVIRYQFFFQNRLWILFSLIFVLLNERKNQFILC